FLYLLGMENRAFKQAYPENQSIPSLSSISFQIATNIKPNDPSTLLGQELPGFSSFGNKIIVAGEGTNYSNLSFESSPPLKDVLKDREAVLNEPEEDVTEPNETEQYGSTGDRQVVYI